MNTGIFIIAHAPLASALRDCVLHVFPDASDGLLALDVPPGQDPEQTLAAARVLLSQLDAPQALVLTDVFGATPCNVAQKMAGGQQCKLLAGVNLPMLLRIVNYRSEPLDVLVTRAMAGGTQSIMQVAVTAPQNQHRKTHDQQPNDHSQ
jgi:PTS system ascorbate-specific IIA component